MTQTNVDSTTELLTVAEACEALRISKWSLYRLIQQRKLTTITIGTRRLVPRQSVEEFVGALVAEERTS
jgi:excisionase family DNA binding protein